MSTLSPILSFYGDDFTGSTDALEFITRAGANAVLFIDTPTDEQLVKHDGLQVIGVAGKTRALSPEKMEEELVPAFERLKAIGSKHIHYKVCSTFDSSPTIGSIGKAIDIGADIFQHALVPVLGGMPSLGRYCVFGNLFAQMGIGSNGAIYRLDRHPSMSKHPVTPADESDLRKHLAKQTNKNIGLIDIRQLDHDNSQWAPSLMQDERVVLIDCMYDHQLKKIGNWLDQLAHDQSPLFSVGSSALEKALGDHWKETDLLNAVNEWQHPGKAESLLVISGSCSPVTSKQIEWALANGFEEKIIDAIAVAEGNAVDHLLIEETIALLSAGKHVIVHTGGKQGNNLPAEKLGTALGEIARKAVEAGTVKRVLISGGDTSSYAARAMGIEAVKMIAPIIAGAPLCRVFASNPAVNGIEVNVKGGQVGDADYFGKVLSGG